MDQPLSAWARVDVELAFLAAMAMSGPLRPDIGGIPISYTSGVVPFGLVLSVPFWWSQFGLSGRHPGWQDGWHLVDGASRMAPRRGGAYPAKAASRQLLN